MYRQSFSQPLQHLPQRAAIAARRRIAPSQRRFLSTATPPHQRSRSWKSSALRWGLAIGGVYFYNTHPVFAEEPSALLHADSDEDQVQDDSTPSLDSKGSSVLASATSSPPSLDHHPSSPNAAANPSELEEEASTEGAFNPVTGEINWDCPCLGGMAHGPCGEEFKAAFSCFVFSTEEPKGMDCIDRFQGMQECFRAHPDVYRGELEDYDEIPEEEMDEAMREERRKLDLEVAERRAALEEAGPQKRLLDDTPAQPPKRPTPTQSRPPPSSSPAETHPQTPPSQSQQPPPPQSSPSPSNDAPTSAPTQPSDPQPSHPTSQAARTEKEDVQKKAEESKIFDEDLELMPKAWHDQRDAKPESESEKGKRTKK